MIGFATHDYRELALNRLVSLDRVGVRQAMLVSLDPEIHAAFEERGLPMVCAPCPRGTLNRVQLAHRVSARRIPDRISSRGWTTGTRSRAIARSPRRSRASGAGSPCWRETRLRSKWHPRRRTGARRQLRRPRCVFSPCHSRTATSASTSSSTTSSFTPTARSSPRWPPTTGRTSTSPLTAWTRIASSSSWTASASGAGASRTGWTAGSRASSGTSSTPGSPSASRRCPSCRCASSRETRRASSGSTPPRRPPASSRWRSACGTRTAGCRSISTTTSACWASSTSTSTTTARATGRPCARYSPPTRPAAR